MKAQATEELSKKDIASMMEGSIKDRAYIQDDLRIQYKDLKSTVKSVTNIKAPDFKHLVDMVHYRNGGYPQENSKPKHDELITKFVQLVEMMEFTGIKLYDLKEYGIDVKLLNPLSEYNIKPNDIGDEYKKEFKGITKGSDFMRKALSIGDDLQGEICVTSDKIKDLGKYISKNSTIKSGHYTRTVFTEYQRDKAARENKNKRVDYINSNTQKELNSHRLLVKIVNPKLKGII
jgi:hypothetical protein